jgi:IS5 family transposase
VSRATAQQISFADWELRRRGICLEPLLQAISNFLDDQRKIVEQVRRDLARGLKNPKSGRRGLSPQQVLRSLILKRVKNWDYRELRERIADGMTLRQFTEFHWQRVPKHHAFHRDFNRLTPDTLKAINELVVQAAQNSLRAALVLMPSPPPPFLTLTGPAAGRISRWKTDYVDGIDTR